MLPPRRPGFTPDACAFGGCRLTLADYVHAIRHEPRTRAWLRAATIAGAASGALGLFWITTPRVAPGVALLLLCAACFATHDAPAHVATRWLAKTPPEARSLRFTLSPDALLVVSDVSQRAHPWHSLSAFCETPESFLVWLDERSFLILPKRAFEAGDLPRVGAHLERELGPPPLLPPFWRWLLAGAALLLGGLGLWNWLSPR